MTDTARWDRYKAKHPVDELGDFENKHGERFVIYRNIRERDGAAYVGSFVYITGDEFDWAPRVNLLSADFMFSEAERNEVARILWPSGHDVMLAHGWTCERNGKGGATYSPPEVTETTEGTWEES